MAYRYPKGNNSVFKFLAALLLITFFPSGAKAQLSITTGVSPATLVSNLVGYGMTVSNVTLNCPSNAYGTFSNGNTTNLGISSGIILTSGSATGAIGPNNTSSFSSCNGTIFNDPQLTSLSPQANHDPCILQFDVVPQCNTLTIRFVFGSEEYPEFVSSGFNDAFGFWISGPGPACQPGYYNNTNVATLPNNTTVVSINNVNNFTNSAYYVNNNGGATIQYDGMTTVLTRSITLCPCQTYHWKLAIADALDCNYDSGVFLDFLNCSTILSATALSTPETCGACNGTATASASGSGPFTYSWAPSGGNAATATGLCPGTYTCTVDDAVSCAPPVTVTAVVGSTGTAVTATSAQTNLVCNGDCNGSASVTVTSGTGPYTYAWSPSGGSADTAAGLCAGTYTCLVTATGGCTITQSFTITSPSAVAATQSQTDVSCNGACDGSATVVASGGVPGYTYAWSPGGGTAATETGLCANSYTCTITDVSGCSAQKTFTVSEPAVLTSSQSQINVSCNGGANGMAVVNASGGTPGYSYLWNPSGQTNDTATGLSAGAYTCAISDLHGCTITQSFTITEPPALTLASAGFNVTCFNSCDGQIVVIPNGGVTPYNFLWNTGCANPSCNGICAGSYTVNVTDANGCLATSSVTVTQPTAISIITSEVDAHCDQPDGSAAAAANGGTGTLNYQWISGPANANYNNIPPNTYSVIVTDANGCSDTATATVNNLSGVSTTLVSSTNCTCFQSNNGTIATNAMGGNSPYTYNWSPNVSATNSATGLAPGNYQLTVVDVDGCSSTITATITEPTDVTIIASATPQTVCSGAGIQLSSNAAGGTPGYNYLWSPGTLIGNNQNIIPAASTTYTAYVADANGCSDSATVSITVNPVPTAAIQGDITSGCAPWCVHFTDLSTVVSPGIINSWSWNFGDASAVATIQNPMHCFTNPGNYTVTLNIVTNDGCTATVNMPDYVNAFPLPVAAFSASPQPTTIVNPLVNFTDMSTNTATWHWSFGDTLHSTSTLQNPDFIFTSPDCFDVVLAVESADGCVDTTDQFICIGPEVTVYVPNAFTPNGDGKNDYFMPVGNNLDPDHFEMWVFDRWGNLIFETTDISKGWDGKVNGHSEVAQTDTYVWKIQMKDVNGNPHNMVGHVSLIK
jgi:gliding motility-associated-like protein